jgi:DNA-binding NarL/FixJ family response regulator
VKIRPRDVERRFGIGLVIRVGWARPDSRFRRVLTAGLIPTASEEQMCWVDDLQRTSTSAETAIRAAAARRKVDVTDLAPDVAVPTTVLHARGDRMNTFEEGRLLAATIPGARMVPLESDNHILLADEPAWPVFLAEMDAFLEPDRERAIALTAPVESLTSRELEVLHLAARGLDNAAIAARLTVSTRTVERHLSNTYRKLGLSGRSARAAAVAHVLMR